MASANSTLTEVPTTLEVDTNAATATKAYEMYGTIVNGGATKVYLAFNGATLATTDAQAVGVVGLSAGASMKIMRHYTSIQYKVSTGTSFLYWMPDAAD